MSRDRSILMKDRHPKSLRRERESHPNTALDAMRRSLRRISQYPFSEEIENTKMPCHFTCEHMNHFTKLMALYY